MKLEDLLGIGSSSKQFHLIRQNLSGVSLKILMLIIFVLLLVGCGINEPDRASGIFVSSGSEVVESDNFDIQPSLSERNPPPESKGDGMKTPPMKEENSALPGLEIYNFDSDEPDWYTVDDRVMGGVSSSTVEVLDSNILRFTGTMSLESNGGFSSARSDWKSTDLASYDGVLLRVLGDGKKYRLRIRTSETGSEISYNAIFETNNEEWQVYYIPFKEMVPTYRGYVVDVQPLDRASIGSFGFMLSDKQPGDFNLQVDWIRAVSEDSLLDFKTN